MVAEPLATASAEQPGRRQAHALVVVVTGIGDAAPRPCRQRDRWAEVGERCAHAYRCPYPELSLCLGKEPEQLHRLVREHARLRLLLLVLRVLHWVEQVAVVADNAAQV